ncbi:MAG: putative transposase [Pseudonocardiales bacterium]|jgi:transposase-like protein|nr:putative transposase [Pseudonocardiales bacterium]
MQPEAITALWPLATVQTCVVQLVRNSLRYASKADWGKISAQLKTVCNTVTVPAAEQRFAEFSQQWKGKYPAMIGMWERSWTEFAPFLQFPVGIRELIYTQTA